MRHREKTKHEKQVSETPPASREGYTLLLRDFCFTLVGFCLVLLLKHKRCFSSWRAVVLGVQGALSLLLLPLVWPNNL